MQFQSIVGQTHAKSRLIQMVKTDRLPHALLLYGSEGVGKLALATALAQYINCDNPSENDSCGVCVSCKQTMQLMHPDIHYLLPLAGSEKELSDKAAEIFEKFRGSFLESPYYSLGQWQLELGGKNTQLRIKVEDIREAKRQIMLTSVMGKYKVWIVWGVEKMNESAANAFLKVLEEPPEKTLMIMTTSDPSQLLATINSRCQRLFIDRLTPTDIAHFLQAHNGLSQAQAENIAHIAEGSMRVAVSYLEENNQTLQQLYESWLRKIYIGNYAEITKELEPLIGASREYQKAFILLAIKKLRISLLFRLDLASIAPVTEEEKGFHQKFSQLLTPEKVGMMVAELEKSLRYLAGNANQQMVFISLSLRLHAMLRS